MVMSRRRGFSLVVLGDPEVTANLYCNFAYLYWEGCVICSIYLRYILGHPVDSIYPKYGFLSWIFTLFILINLLIKEPWSSAKIKHVYSLCVQENVCSRLTDFSINSFQIIFWLHASSNL